MPFITEECKAFADEYEKNTELLQRDLKELRAWLKTQRHLPEIKDELLFHFFHSCFYDMKNTKACIESYCVLRSNSPDVFTDRDVTNPDLIKALEAVYLVMLPKPDPSGNRIVYNGLRDPDPSKFKYLEINKLGLMSMDAYLEHFEPQPGIVIVLSMKGAKLAHLAKHSLSIARRCIQYQQEANPIRLKSIHIIHVVSWVDKALAFLRPFMKKEVLEMLHFHTDGLESLYEYIPKECLPEDLGGSQKSLEELQADALKFLESTNDFLMAQSELKVDDSKRQKKSSKKNKDIKPESIMFNKLEID